MLSPLESSWPGRLPDVKQLRGVTQLGYSWLAKGRRSSFGEKHASGKNHVRFAHMEGDDSGGGHNMDRGGGGSAYADPRSVVPAVGSELLRALVYALTSLRLTICFSVPWGALFLS